MNARFLPLVAVVLLAALAHAEESSDLRAPKAEDARLLRIFLYVPGSPRLIDYPDVQKILSCEKDRVAFVTQDGSVILHHGPFTVIQPRGAADTVNDGSKFYDPR